MERTKERNEMKEKKEKSTHACLHAQAHTLTVRVCLFESPQEEQTARATREWRVTMAEA